MKFEGLELALLVCAFLIIIQMTSGEDTEDQLVQQQQEQQQPQEEQKQHQHTEEEINAELETIPHDSFEVMVRKKLNDTELKNKIRSVYKIFKKTARKVLGNERVRQLIKRLVTNPN
ncbi:uncharacterized protein [Eurosta solidaginis]|uniref:uncharacterized protein n=1 Tax=Eurosta solidaginis TaxID=178769 RepID=UPI0035308247